MAAAMTVLLEREKFVLYCKCIYRLFNYFSFHCCSYISTCFYDHSVLACGAFQTYFDFPFPSSPTSPKKGDHENVMTLRIGSLFSYRRRGWQYTLLFILSKNLTKYSMVNCYVPVSQTNNVCIPSVA